MLKFFSKSSSVIAGALVVAGTVALPLTTLAQSDLVNPAVTDVAPLLLIQGKVTGIRGSVVIVKTPDTRTSPAVIIAGPTFNVDISSATFQSATGKSITPPPTLVVGDSIAVAGRQGATPVSAIPTPAGPNKLIIAEVVATIVP